LLLAADVRADVGTLRRSEERGGRRITVLTSPTPLRAGTVEVKVLVQQTGRTIPDVQVKVKTSRGDRRQQAAAVASSPFHVATLELAESGRWRIEVEVEKSAPVGFDVEVAEPAPSWHELAPWVAWPIVPIVLFAVHQGLVRRGRIGRG
jgi:hypothetical protein